MTKSEVFGFFPIRLETHPENRRSVVDNIRCGRCDKDAPKMEKAPFRNAIGERVHAEICQDCWAEWLQHQTLLINHYGLDPRDPKAKDFLYEQIRIVLLEGGEGDQLDTSQQGSIKP